MGCAGHCVKCRAVAKVLSSQQANQQPNGSLRRSTKVAEFQINNEIHGASYPTKWVTNQDATNFCPACRLKFAGCCRWRLLFAASRQLKATPYPMRASRRFSNRTSDPSTHRGCETLLKKLWKCRGRHGVKWASYHDRSATPQTWIGCGFWSQWQFFFDPLAVSYCMLLSFILS